MNRWILPALMVSSLAACASAPHSTPGVAALAMDSAITEQVRSQLAGTAPAADIAVHTEQGKVMLRGAVSDAEQARHAVKTALSVDGVRGVVNELQIAPQATRLAASTTKVD